MRPATIRRCDGCPAVLPVRVRAERRGGHNRRWCEACQREARRLVERNRYHTRKARRAVGPTRRAA